MKKVNVGDLNGEEFGPHKTIALLFKRALDQKGVCIYKKSYPPSTGTTSLRAFTKTRGIPYQQFWQLLRGLSIPSPKKTIYYCQAVGMTSDDEMTLAMFLAIQARTPENYRLELDQVIETLIEKLELR